MNIPFERRKCVNLLQQIRPSGGVAFSGERILQAGGGNGGRGPRHSYGFVLTDLTVIVDLNPACSIYSAGSGEPTVQARSSWLVGNF